MPSLHQVYFGLGQIAYSRKNVPAAIQHYEAYLKYAPTGTDEAKQITERLKQLKTGTGH